MDDKKRELFEVKDDEEQRAKLQDICDLLLAAGYFRVRVKGLSAFDKVVGGIVWCLELCAVDVDVNFLFRENLNIGEKIEITEKIIKVLIAIKCAYALEPHQIQGLDTVKILPVVQWLVKRAMETRESLNDHLSSMANLQFRKSFPIPESEKAVTETSKHLSKLFQPQRKFKKVVDPNESLPLEKQVISTLMEYGHQSAFQVADGNGSQPIERTGEVIVNKSENKKVETRAIAQRVSSLIHQQADVISEAIQGYAGRQTEREGPVDELAQLQTSHKNMTEALDKVSRQISSQEEVMGQLQNKLADLIAAEKQLAERRRSLSAFNTEENRQVLAQLDELITKNEAINADRKQFKSQCKDQLEQLQLRNQGLNADKPAVESENKIQLKLDHVREQLNGAQKTLGEKNVAVSRLKRQLDSVPGNAELNQYQRRFTELCTQVNEKQTELNGYYLLYNTLEDTKVYLNKELSLLTSIHDGFSQSMSTASGKGEFLQQMEKIVCAVKQNKNKIEKQIESLTEKHRDLGRCLADFASEEHQYREILKSITQESQKYKQLLQMQKDD